MSRRLDERAARVADLARKRNQSALVDDENHREAYARWRHGYVIPDRITMFLDYRDLYGPDVDHACGVEEPTVDQWEAGEVYPTWEQLTALAALCQVGPICFTDAWGSSNAPITSTIFICDRTRPGNSLVIVPNPILRFTRDALAAHRQRLDTPTEPQ